MPDQTHTVPARPPARAAAGLAVLAALAAAAGCGSGTPASAAELDRRARQAGVTVELVYVLDLDGYHRVAGGLGGYGADGFQDIYVPAAAAGAGELRLTVERRALTAADCPTLPVPAAEPPRAPVRCTPDGQGWWRVSGTRAEYAWTDHGLLIRLSGPATASTPDLLHRAAAHTHRASARQLDRMLPPEAGPGTPPRRGDLPSNGDGAPDNHTGAGG